MGVQKEETAITPKNITEPLLPTPSPETTNNESNESEESEIKDPIPSPEHVSDPPQEPPEEKIETTTPEKSTPEKSNIPSAVDPLDQAESQNDPQLTQSQSQNQSLSQSGSKPPTALNPIGNRVITLEELRKFFHLPIAEVAKQFGTCTTALKKICRKLQINKWPYRQILSLSKSIQSLEMASLSDGVSNEQRAQYRSQISILQQMIAEVVQDPSKAMESLSKELESSAMNKVERNADVENLINAATATLSKSSSGPAATSSSSQKANLSGTGSSSQQMTNAVGTTTSSHKSKYKSLKRSSDSMDDEGGGIVLNGHHHSSLEDSNRLKKGKLREDDHFHGQTNRTLFSSPNKPDQYQSPNGINGTTAVSSSGILMNGTMGLNLHQKVFSSSSNLGHLHQNNRQHHQLSSSGNNNLNLLNSGNNNNSLFHHHHQLLRANEHSHSPMPEILHSSVEVGLTTVNCSFAMDSHKFQFSGQVHLAPLHRKKFRPSAIGKVIPLMEPDIGSSFSVDFYPTVMIPKP